MRKFPSSWLGVVLLVGLALVTVQCSGGGGSGGGAMDVVAFSATLQSPRVYLNDEIVIEFTQSVDPQTVFSGIYIYPSVSAGAKRAQGQWRVEGKSAIFTPTLPTNSNYTNGGFVPNTEYTVCVPMAGDACSVHIQNVPGLRSTSGRGMSINRVEKFLTVDLQTQDPFRPEVAPQRPAIARMDVIDSKGVQQKLNPITNLYTNALWTASVLTTMVGNPATTLTPVQPPLQLTVPRYEWVNTQLTKSVFSEFKNELLKDQGDVISYDPLSIVMRNPSQPIVPGEFENTGGLLVIRDSSTPPIEARWAIDTNTATVITTKAGSGRDLSIIPYKTLPLVATIDQGITRQVAPGDINEGSELKVTFNEPITPPLLSSFVMYKVSDSPQGLQFAVIPAASTLVGAARQGITHEVINNQSVVTLRPKASFPQSKPGDPATIVLWIATAQLDNAADPVKKSGGVRDLNDFPLAYPVQSGWQIAADDQGLPRYTGYIKGFDYTSNVPSPGNIQTMWGFQTRGDTVALNAVVEEFTTRENIATDCPTTASWTKDALAGLYATFGYGGNGELGDKTVQGSETLDSSTETPGPDGFVNYNFNRLTIPLSGNLVLMGTHPIRINSVETITVEGTIDASGLPGLNAPAGTASSVGRILGGRGGPAGGTGGTGNDRPNDILGSLPMDLRGGPGWPPVSAPPQGQCGEFNRSANRLITVIEENCGGGTGGNRGTIQSSVLRDGCSGNGGAHEADGQQTDFVCQNLQGFGKEHGVEWAYPEAGIQETVLPTAGSAGGGGGNAETAATGNATNDICGASGGGGGGALELVSADVVWIKGSGQVLARGGNGGAGYTSVVAAGSVTGGFGGGGAGGSIWLSGTSATVDSGATIDARPGTGNPNPPTSGRGGDGGEGYNIIRDTGGSPTVNSGATVTPTYVNSRRTYTPLVNGKSEAYSTWYDSGEADPNWTFDGNNPTTGVAESGKDLEWLNQPVQGQTVTIMFQGAPDLGGSPNPNPTTWHPAGNTVANPCATWEPDVTKIKASGNKRYIRFRVQFDIGERKKGQATPPSRAAIQRIKINYPDV